MNNIKEILITEEEIQNRVYELAKEIERDYNDELLMICILKGSALFMSDLIKRIDRELEIEFMQVSSYEGINSTGKINIIKDIETDIRGRDVLVIEDIIDTGNTLSYLIEDLKQRGAKSVEIVTLLSKAARREQEVECKYIGFEIEDKFVIGYGMDLDEKYRNLPYIGIFDESALS